jgi:hypothetical protein
MKNNHALVGALLLALPLVIAASDGQSHWTKPYNIVWNTPSKDSAGTMPIGGGNLGLNVWVEKGELAFYIGCADAFDVHGNNIKLGRIRITTQPAIFPVEPEPEKPFRQELELESGAILFQGGTPSGAKVSGRIWVDVQRPVIHVQFDSAEPVAYTVAYESWPANAPRFKAQATPQGLQWSHRLDQAAYDAVRKGRIAGMGMAGLEAQVLDPGRNLTMGGRVIGRALEPAGEVDGIVPPTPFHATKVRTREPVKSFEIRVLIRAAQDADMAMFQAALDRLEHDTQNTAKQDLARTGAWWRAFWDRSHIVIKPNLPAEAREKDPAWTAARNYQLFRHILGCNSTGRFPQVFNGGLFTADLPSQRQYNDVENKNPPGRGADNRLWAGCHFMAQNQRLLHWPMIKAGDEDMMRLNLAFYQERAAAQRARAMKLWDVDGVPFCELFDWMGLTPKAVDGHSKYQHLKHHYTTALEHAYMMLEFCRFSGTPPKEYVDTALGVAKFYDGYYRRLNKQRTGRELDEHGKLVIEPGNALETYGRDGKLRNNTDAIAGLQAVVEGVLATPPGALSEADMQVARELRSRLPDMPIEAKRGVKILAPAEIYGGTSNMEFPQLYAVFPFARCGLGLPDLQLARNTWHCGWFNRDRSTFSQDMPFCWFQQAIFAARLGLVEDAKSYMLAKMNFGSNPDVLHAWADNNLLRPSATMRYPAFFASTLDHVPDMDHGGSGMIGLQEMLMQTPGRQILLLPAWPSDWDVDFKLHAPYQTTVEGRVRAGKLCDLKVTPPSRMADLMDMTGKITPDERPMPLIPISQGKPATASSVWPQPGYEPDKAFDNDPRTRWSTAAGQTSAWLEVDLGAPTEIGRAVIDESSYPQASKFSFEAQMPDGAWKTVVEGGAMGANKELNFAPVKARKFRLHVQEAKLINAHAGVTVNEFQLFAPAK